MANLNHATMPENQGMQMHCWIADSRR